MLVLKFKKSETHLAIRHLCVQDFSHLTLLGGEEEARGMGGLGGDGESPVLEDRATH
jgi:hypothetical protein